MGNQQISPTNIQNISVYENKACCQKVSLFIEDKTIDPSDISCPICFQIYKQPRIMKCKHTFCQQCIADWGKCKTASCPYCRTELKRAKSNYGKIDRKTEKKIEKTTLKCRSCHWTGNAFMFKLYFGTNPTLDDEELPCEKIHEEAEATGDDRIKVNEECQQKKQVCEVQTEKLDFTPTKQNLDDYWSPQHKKVMNLIQGQSIFIDEQPAQYHPFYLDMDQMAFQLKQKTWQDLLFSSDNDNQF